MIDGVLTNKKSCYWTNCELLLIHELDACQLTPVSEPGYKQPALAGVGGDYRGEGPVHIAEVVPEQYRYVGSAVYVNALCRQ